MANRNPRKRMPVNGSSRTFPKPSLTVDVVLWSTQKGKLGLWLIQRKTDPFRKHWALPGGFVDAYEPLQKAAARELAEETGLKKMESAFVELGAFGDPGRDPRGWTVSVVFMAWAEAGQLKLKAGDDASKVKWYPINKLPKLAFDHAKIIDRAQASLSDQLHRLLFNSPHWPKRFRWSKLKAVYSHFHLNAADVKALKARWINEGLLVKTRTKSGKKRFELKAPKP